MQELLVLSNPRRRRKHKAKRRSRSRRKMSALQRQYFGGGRRVRRRSRRAIQVLSNPRKRGPGRPRKVRSYRRRQRGGINIGAFRFGGGSAGNLAKPFSMIGPALTGAIGAVAVNTVISRLPLPPMLMTGKMRYLTQAGVAIGLGMAASKFRIVGSNTAAKMAEGALIVTLNDAIKEFASDAGINLGGMGYYLPGRTAIMPNASGRPGVQLGKYVSGPGSNVTPMRSRMGNINTFKF